MADTLSRKHRLNKQHEQQQQLQQFAGNQRHTFATYDNLMSAKNGRQRTMKSTGSDYAPTPTSNVDGDEACFEVFRVVEVGTNTGESFCSKERQQQGSGGNNFRGDANVVRSERRMTCRDGELRHSNNNMRDDDCNHWREHSIYEDSTRATRKTNHHHATSSSSNYQQISSAAKNHSSLNGSSSTTKSLSGNSSSGFSSSNGSGSSTYISPLKQQQQHPQKQQQNCVAKVGNNNNKQQQRGQFYGHERGMAGAMVGKKSKLIDDLDRLLMLPPTSNGHSVAASNIDEGRCSINSISSSASHHRRRGAGRGLIADNHHHQQEEDVLDAEELRRRRSSLVSPTESHISTATNMSARRTSSNFAANESAANDFDYSTLCRDEFSSFIQIEPKVTAPPKPASNDSGCGPMLVGIHETESNSNVHRLIGVGGGGHAIVQHDYDDDDEHNNNISDEVQSDEVEPYNEFKPIHHDDDGEDEEEEEEEDNVYEEIPNSNSMPFSMNDQLSSPPIISTSPSCSGTSVDCYDATNNHDDEVMTNSSPFICQNYSPDVMNCDDGDDADGSRSDDYCKSLELSVGNASIDNNSGLVFHGSNRLKGNNDCDNLSSMLDIYVEKVNSLIRLTKNDKSISIQEAFRRESIVTGEDKDEDEEGKYYFKVSAELRTPVAFVTLDDEGGRENFMRIIQEVVYDDDNDETAGQSGDRIGDAHDQRRTIVTHISDYKNSLNDERQNRKALQIHNPLKSILESIQISPELCWSRNKQQYDECDIHSNDDLLVSKKQKTDIKYLEELLINRLSRGSSSEVRDNHDDSRLTRVPVATIREHLREFIENYRTYQSELSRKTSFADGSWHENWLFATKRSRQYNHHHQSASSIHQQQEVSSAKRPRYSIHHDDEQEQQVADEKGQRAARQVSNRCGNKDEKEEENEKADLIKYSTLILAKCKPVKLTLMTTNSVGDDDDNNSGSRQGHHHPRNHEHADSRHQQQDVRGRSDVSCHIASLYEAQLDRISELELVAIESSRQTDVCRLLLHDTDDDDCDDGDTKDSNNNSSGGKRESARPDKSLLVSYDSTNLTPALHHANKFYFTASGYLFQTSLIKFPIASSKLRAKLESRILNKLISCVGEQSQSATISTTASTTTVVNNATSRLHLFSSNGCSGRTFESERARFVISLSNLELINRLPVIQFCAKIAGSLPIRVRWFRQSQADSQQQDQYEELSDITANARRKNLHIRSMADGHSRWPIELQASYDYEYQTSSASWFRFRRDKDDILFEIREPNLNTDYNRLYKCLIENAYSKRECKFQLTTKRLVDSIQSNCDRQAAYKKMFRSKAKNPRAMLETAATAGDDEKDGHALLRTWSQRTLNKPQPTEPKVPTDAEQQTNYDLYEGVKLSSTGTSGRQQTVGRLSASSVNEDKFGKNFPYHPENLLKRLEENKFSIPAKRMLVTGGGGGCSDGGAATSATTATFEPATMNDCRLTSSEPMLEKESQVVAASEYMWTNSKTLIDDEVAESHYPKQPRLVREQLASANNNNGHAVSSGLHSTHAGPMQLVGSHRPLANNKHNSGHSKDEGYDNNADDDALGKLEERPRAVINPRPLINTNICSEVDDSASRLKLAMQQQQDDDNRKNDTSEVLSQQQPRPRRRLTVSNSSCTSNNKEPNQKENSRLNEHNHRGTASIGRSHQQQVNDCAGIDRPALAPKPSQPQATTASNHQKPSGSNVRSLISQFSMA